VQITLASKGPAVRAEATADSFYAALDAAVTKLENRLRRSADRRHDHQHGRTPITAIAATPEEILGGAAPVLNGTTTAVLEGQHVAGAWLNSSAEAVPDDGLEDAWAAAADGGPGQVVRIKEHPAEPITVDQALFQMELVGHDFYLFLDADTKLASVVYRRKGFDYGLLRLT
jgi:hypothetical protein